MLGKATLVCMIGSAVAFAPGTPSLRTSPVTMQMEGVSRREIVQGAIAGAAVVAAAPSVMAQPVPGKGQITSKKVIKMKGENYAPIITILDHRGCESNAAHKEYKGPASGDENDEMVIIVRNTKLNRDDPRFVDLADRVLSESLSEFYGYKR